MVAYAALSRAACQPGYHGCAMRRLAATSSVTTSAEYAAFCRRFEAAATAEVLRHDPARTAVLVNDISEGPDFGRLAAAGYPIVTIYHVDVVAYVSAIYARQLVGPQLRLSAATRDCGAPRSARSSPQWPSSFSISSATACAIPERWWSPRGACASCCWARIRTRRLKQSTCSPGECATPVTTILPSPAKQRLCATNTASRAML
jgi:hypothetical protein